MRWQSLGPDGGYIKCFAFDDHGRVYAGGDDSSGVWASDDDGITWSHVTSDLVDLCGWHITCLGDRVIVADHYGRHPIAVSEDRGRTWESRGHDQPTRRAKQASVVLVHPDEPDHFIIGTGTDRMRPGDGVWVSRDAGETWQRSGFPLSAVNHLVLHDGVVFAGVNTPDHSGSTETAGLYQSTDFGESWSPVPSWPAGARVSALAISPEGSIFVGTLTTESSLLRSDDGGATWDALPIAGQAIWKVAHGRDGEILAGCFVGGGAVQRSKDGGATWSASTGTESRVVMGLGVSPATGTTFAGVFANTGAYRSTDAGATFTRSTSGLIASMPTNIRAGSLPGHLYATMLGTYNLMPDDDVCAVLETRDHGATWQRLGPVPAHGLNLDVHPTEPNRLLLGTFGKGLYASDDGGQNWSTVGGAGVIRAASWLPDGGMLSSRIFVSAAALPEGFDDDAPVPKAAVERRDPNGEWETIRDGFAPYEFHCHDDVVLSVGDEGTMISIDNARTWRTVRPSASRTGAISDDVIVVDDGPRAVAISRDGGETWVERTLPIEPDENRWLHGIAINGQRIIVGSDGAEWNQDGSGDRLGTVLISDDLGASWRREDSGLSCRHVWGVTIDSAHDAYVATYGGGVFRLPSND
ncbi:MAG: photosystem II stability/assembly factor-like uncharacterized protein [Glaciecola sp.]|jgi:photosystem II stability/assembly factor-like uncharacterized protein